MALAHLLAAPGPRAEVVDRVAAVVGRDAVALSEIDLQLRLEAMLNMAEYAGLERGARDALQRLIDRRLILQDIAPAPFLMPDADEVSRHLRQIAQQRYLGGRDFSAALEHYDLAESDLRSFLRDRLALERYVSFRFKTGLDAAPQDIEAYYREEYARRQRARGEAVAPLEAVSGAISRMLVERRADELLENRLKELRAVVRIETRLPDGWERDP